MWINYILEVSYIWHHHSYASDDGTHTHTQLFHGTHSTRETFTHTYLLHNTHTHTQTHSTHNPFFFISYSLLLIFLFPSLIGWNLIVSLVSVPISGSIGTRQLKCCLVLSYSSTFIVCRRYNVGLF